MNKRIVTVVIISIISIVLISLYTTFAFNEEERKLSESEADFNLIYDLKEESNHRVIVLAGEEKFVDIVLNNTYNSNVKYGMYYYLVQPKKLPDGVTIGKSSNSVDLLENIINPGKTRSISIKITNNSEDSVELIVGALVGFESGNIADLAKNGEVLIK